MNHEARSYYGERMHVKRRSNGELILSMEKRDHQSPTIIFCNDIISDDVERMLTHGFSMWTPPRDGSNTPRWVKPTDDDYLHQLIIFYIQYGYNIDWEPFFINRSGEAIT